MYFSLASRAMSSYVFFSSGPISLHISPSFLPTSVKDSPGCSVLIRSLTALLNMTKDVAGFFGSPCCKGDGGTVRVTLWAHISYRFLRLACKTDFHCSARPLALQCRHRCFEIAHLTQ